MNRLPAHDLDGDLAIVSEVVCEIDRRHSARAELALDAVAIGQRSLEGIRYGRGQAKGECRTRSMTPNFEGCRQVLDQAGCAVTVVAPESPAPHRS